MFRALKCPSSGGQIVLSQHLVSSLSVNGCTVCRMRADSESALVLKCPSSGAQIVLSQHLVSSLSVNGCTVCRMRADCESALIRHTVLYCTESDDTRCCDNAICPPEDGHVNARNKSRIVM